MYFWFNLEYDCIVQRTVKGNIQTFKPTSTSTDVVSSQYIVTFTIYYKCYKY